MPIKYELMVACLMIQTYALLNEVKTFIKDIHKIGESGRFNKNPSGSQI